LEEVKNQCKNNEGIETGELLIHHTDEFGNAAVLSIIFTDDGEVDNEFFKSLKINSWKEKSS